MTPDYLAEVRRLHMTEVNELGAQGEKEPHFTKEVPVLKDDPDDGVLQ